MPHTVAVGEFEGPLGILLELVEHGRLEVTSISVSAVTKGYLERIRSMEQRSPEDLSDFLALGSRLLHIKSLALLPGTAADEQASELHQLNLELSEYHRFQTAAQNLVANPHRRSWSRPPQPKRATTSPGLPEIGLDQLAAAFQNALRYSPANRPTGIIRQHLSLDSVLERLHAKLRMGRFELQSLLDQCRDRLELIVTFTALLELVRSGSARAAQTSQFEPITIEATGV